MIEIEPIGKVRVLRRNLIPSDDLVYREREKPYLDEAVEHGRKYLALLEENKEREDIYRRTVSSKMEERFPENNDPELHTAVYIVNHAENLLLNSLRYYPHNLEMFIKRADFGLGLFDGTNCLAYAAIARAIGERKHALVCFDMEIGTAVASLKEEFYRFAEIRRRVHKAVTILNSSQTMEQKLRNFYVSSYNETMIPSFVLPHLYCRGFTFGAEMFDRFRNEFDTTALNLAY